MNNNISITIDFDTSKKDMTPEEYIEHAKETFGLELKIRTDFEPNWMANGPVFTITGPKENLKRWYMEDYHGAESDNSVSIVDCLAMDECRHFDEFIDCWKTRD